MEKITYGRQFIDDEDIACVINALKSEAITQGEYVPAFEKALQDYTGAKYAVALSNGTAALHIIYKALGVCENSEVITSPITFAATSNASLYLGGSVKFVDISVDDFLISVENIEKEINNNTKIIVPVHYGGLPANMEVISNIAKKHNLFVVEDACHSIGSLYKNEKMGNCIFSDACVFSFHPVKHITTGEGGAILTNDYNTYKKCLSLRSHGMVKDDFINEIDSPTYHEMQDLGFNYRMTDMQAALGISQLKKLDSFIKKRRKISKIYREEFENINQIKMQKEYSDRINSYHLFPVLFENSLLRDKVFYTLKENNIFTQIHYIPVNKHPYYKNLGYNYKDTPHAYDFYQRELSLPIYYSLKDSEVAKIIDIIKNVIKSA